MSDQKLRDLERRWRETGSVDDEAAYLLERVRVGDLTLKRLELAAYCGHAAARQACPGMELRPDSDLIAWMEQVEKLGGNEACAVVALAAAAVGCEVGVGAPWFSLLDEARRLVCAWLVDRAIDVHVRAQPVREGIRADLLAELRFGGGGSLEMLSVAKKLLELPDWSGVPAGTAGEGPSWGAATVVMAVSHYVCGSYNSVEVMERVRSALVAWCLGRTTSGLSGSVSAE